MRQTRPTALPLALFLAACSGSSQPAGPTPPSTTAPAPAPAPVPTATPQPTPAPPLSGGPKCTLDRSDGTACGKETLSNGQDRTNHYSELQRAQREVKATRPDIFNGHRIQNEAKYMAAVYLKMIEYGYCAEVGPSGDEISLKIGTNTYSEVYDIVFAEGKTPTTDYINTCRPAHF